MGSRSVEAQGAQQATWAGRDKWGGAKSKETLFGHGKARWERKLALRRDIGCRERKKERNLKKHELAGPEGLRKKSQETFWSWDLGTCRSKK